MKRRLLGSLLTLPLLVGALISAPPSAAAPLPSLQVKAHRGGWLAYGVPEESLAALTAAVNDGVPWIEFDVVYTADGVAVLQHDDAIGGGLTGSATCTRAGERIHLMTWAEVGNVQCTDSTSGAVAPVATLRQVLSMLATNPRAAKTKVDLEVKTYPGQPLAEKKAWMTATLKATTAIHARMTISTFFWRELAATVTRYAPTAHFLALEYAKYVTIAKNPIYTNARLAKKVGADGFAYNVNSSDVGQLHFLRALGLDVHLYDFDTNGPNYAQQVRFAIANGQRVIGADDPRQARALIASLAGTLPVGHWVSTPLAPTTVMKRKLTKSKRAYPQVFGSVGAVPASTQRQFGAVQVKVTIAAKATGGSVEVAPRGSRVGKDGVRLKIRKGTRASTVWVSPGDYGDVRVRATRKATVTLVVVGYRNLSFA